jgi:hypothetical protein
MGDLGDLGEFLKEGSLVDLSWLDVDEAEYRSHDRLPQQNLDIVPDLQALWAREDKPPTTYLEPNTAALPRTMGDLSQVHGPLRSVPADIVRTARMIMMVTRDPSRIASSLRRMYDSDSLRHARTALASVLAERGLLGTYYIDAADFPNCTNGNSRDVNFVRRQAGQALYVKAKPACTDCLFRSSGNVCSVFHKQIVLDVPYTQEIAELVEKAQAARGKVVQASSAGPRERIRAAYLAPDVRSERLFQIKPKDTVARLLRPVAEVPSVVLAPDLTSDREAAVKAVDVAFREGRLTVQAAQGFYRDIADATDSTRLHDVISSVRDTTPIQVPSYTGSGQQPVPRGDPDASSKLAAEAERAQVRAAVVKSAMAARKAAPVVALLRREMLKGRGPLELAHAMRLSFSPTDIRETLDYWAPMARKVGSYGVIYITQDSFDNCHEGADFLARYNPGVRVVVAGSKCHGCIHNKIGRCLLYGKPLVASEDDVLTNEMVDTVVMEHRAAGRLDDQAVFSSDNPREALRAVLAAVEQRRNKVSQAFRRSDIQAAFRGAQPVHITAGVTKRDIVATTRRFLNDGLYGRDLGLALMARFDPRDIRAAAEDLRPVLAEQGLQGIFYVDPTIYFDYGHGCEEAARLHRTRLVKYVKVGPKCGSCVHQTRPGWCSKLAKELTVEPPYENKAAQQQAILSSGRAVEVRYEDLVNNGHRAMLEYEMGRRAMAVDVDKPVKTQPLSIEFDRQEVVL